MTFGPPPPGPCSSLPPHPLPPPPANPADGHPTGDITAGTLSYVHRLTAEHLMPSSHPQLSGGGHQAGGEQGLVSGERDALFLCVSFVFVFFVFSAFFFF